MYLNKKLFVLPITRQYEQLCKGEALKKLGAWSAPALNRKAIEDIRQWIKSGPNLILPEIADPAKIARQIISRNSRRIPLSA
jgi:hypothetical protein